MATTTTFDLKRALRAELRERRHAMTARERSEAEAGLRHNLEALTVATSARSVACYLSTPFEPPTRDFIEWLSERDIRVLLPIARNDGLLGWTTGGGAESAGLAGTPELAGEILGVEAISDVDLVLAPAAAVDLRGTRLGWGRGYFDKTIASMKKLLPVYAVVFDHEVLDTVPREDHDRPVHGAVTPTRVLAF